MARGKLEVHLDVLVTEDQRLTLCCEEDIFVVCVVNECEGERRALRNILCDQSVTDHIQSHVDIGLRSINKL